MVKVLQATSRGQVTLPKAWRDQFNTSYFNAEIQGDTLLLKPLQQQKSFEESIEVAWQEYKDGEIVEGSEIMKKYGL